MAAAQMKGRKEKSVWKRVCKFSAYFSVAGAILAASRYYSISQKEAIPAAARSNEQFVQQMESIHSADSNTLYLLCGFAVLNLILFLISLMMLKKEQA